MTTPQQAIADLINDIEQSTETAGRYIDDLKVVWASFDDEAITPTPTPGDVLNLGSAAGGANNNRFADCAASSGGLETGWQQSGGSNWSFSGNGTLTGGPSKNSTLDGFVAPYDHMVGKVVELSFKMTTPDNARGSLFVSTRRTGGKSLAYAGTVKPVITNGARVTVTLNNGSPMPSGWSALQVVVRREGSDNAGTVVISDIAFTEVGQ